MAGKAIRFYRGALCATSLALVLTSAVAQPAFSADALKPTSLGSAPVIPSMASISAEQVTALEADIASLLQRRPDASGLELSLLDYEIDIRVVQRWLLSRAIDPKASPELQACISLRAANLKSLGDQLTQRLQGSSKALLPSQLEGLAKFHKITFKLPAIKTVGTIDEVCKSLVPALVLAGNPAAAEMKSLPPMRPQPLEEAPTPTGPRTRSLAQLTARAKEVQVSPALKRQLAALAAVAQATSVSTDADEREELPQLSSALSAAMDMSDGLERNTGIDPVTKAKIELQLADGVALFTDPRTRSSGAARIEMLNQYRIMVKRIAGLHVPAALQQKLGPVFVWVNKNPDSSAAVLESIEKYIQLCARFDARKETITLAPNQRKSVDALTRQFASQRTAYLEDAASLGAAAGFLSTGPSNLTAHVQTMGEQLDTIDSIEKLPHAMQVLLTFKLKPAGGLEKRTASASADMVLPASLGSRDVSARLISDVERLAQLAESTAAAPAGVSPEMLKAYTRDQLTAVLARRATIISSLGSSLAAGKEMDATEFTKLQTLHDLFESLRLANDVEIGLGRADLLARWADWSISAGQLRALVSPYREATASAFEGFAVDNATPIFRWAEVHKRFLPLLLLTKEAGLYADQCADLPAGIAGDFAKLLTPMENQPFATERFASLAVYVWQTSAATADPKASDVVFEAMLARLRKEFKLE